MTLLTSEVVSTKNSTSKSKAYFSQVCSHLIFIIFAYQIWFFAQCTLFSLFLHKSTFIFYHETYCDDPARVMFLSNNGFTLFNIHCKKKDIESL